MKATLEDARLIFSRLARLLGRDEDDARVRVLARSPTVETYIGEVWHEVFAEWCPLAFGGSDRNYHANFGFGHASRWKFSSPDEMSRCVFGSETVSIGRGSPPRPNPLFGSTLEETLMVERMRGGEPR